MYQQISCRFDNLELKSLHFMNKIIIYRDIRYK